MNKTIGVFAHVDAGKTTFAEQVLFLTNTIKSRGRVDHQNTFLDYHDIERKRGITVFNEQAFFNYKNSNYYLIDTPGHIDFSTEMERAILIMDYAIIIISAVEGIQGHTETIWRLLKNSKIPTFFFINKIDREGANLLNVINQIELRLNMNTLYIENAAMIDEMSNDFIEHFAVYDEELMLHYFEQHYQIEDWKKSLRQIFREQKMVPVMSGSALENIGVEDFLSVIDQLTETSYDCKCSFSGHVYKIRYDEKGEKITFIKATKGSLKVKDILTQHSARYSEKVNQIRIYQGNRYKTVNQIEAGQLFAVTGLKESMIGDRFGECKDDGEMILQPTLQVSVFYPSSFHPTEILAIFKRLESEDPTLRVTWNEESQEIHIHVMGLIQLDVLQELINHRIGIEVSFGPCEVIYKETIDNQVIGRGHYEPLKHYAEVHLKMEPGERGSGITFDSNCHLDILPLSYQNLIRGYVLQGDLKGIMTGSLITDLKVTLLTGAIHEKHTSGGDLKEATYRALRQGLEKANNLLLEPYYDVEIEVDLDLMGRILTDIQKANGEFENPMISEEICVIRGRVPVATFMNYPIEFSSLTKGRGRIYLTVSGYRACHDSKEVMAKMAYDKHSDRDFPSSSIFCSKGSGFVVPWNEADSYMHCEKVD